MKRKIWYLTLLPLLLVSCGRGGDDSVINSSNPGSDLANSENADSVVDSNSSVVPVVEAFDALPKGYKLSDEDTYNEDMTKLDSNGVNHEKFALKIKDGAFHFQLNNSFQFGDHDPEHTSFDIQVSKLNLDLAAIDLNLPAQNSQFSMSLDFTLHFAHTDEDPESHTPDTNFDGDIRMKIDFTDNTLYIHFANDETKQFVNFLYTTITHDETDQAYPDKFKYPQAIPEDNTMTFVQAIAMAFAPSEGDEGMSGPFGIAITLLGVLQGEETFYGYDDGSVAKTEVLTTEALLANIEAMTANKEEGEGDGEGDNDSTIQEEEPEPTEVVTADVKVFKETEYYANKSGFIALDSDLTLSENTSFVSESGSYTSSTNISFSSKLRADISFEDDIAVTLLDDYSDYVLPKTGGQGEEDPDVPPISVAP